MSKTILFCFRLALSIGDRLKSGFEMIGLEVGCFFLQKRASFAIFLRFGKFVFPSGVDYCSSALMGTGKEGSYGYMGGGSLSKCSTYFRISSLVRRTRLPGLQNGLVF
jgi:hypothetical protein